MRARSAFFALVPAIGHAELVDPSVGPAMAAEAGQLYVVISYAVPTLILLSGGLGFFIKHHNVKAKARLRSDSALACTEPF